MWCPGCLRSAVILHFASDEIVMPSTLARFCAVCLLVLTVCPFTAPFSTCDPRLLNSETATDQGPLVKPGSAQEKTSALPALSTVDVVVTDLPTTRASVGIGQADHLPFRSIVLRL